MTGLGGFGMMWKTVFVRWCRFRWFRLGLPVGRSVCWFVQDALVATKVEKLDIGSGKNGGYTGTLAA